MFRTIVVEDNVFMLNYLKNMILKDEEFELVGDFKDAFEAEKEYRNLKADLVIMDVQTLHNHSGIAVGENIKKNSKTKVVIVTSLIDPEILTLAKKGAADSLWYKDHGDGELIEVIKKTMNNEHIFPDTSPKVELNDMFSDDISPRQIDILRRFVKGMTYEEIAEDLKLSKNGVRWNLDQLVEKGGFNNKHELLAAVIENKLIVTTLKDE